MSLTVLLDPHRESNLFTQYHQTSCFYILWWFNVALIICIRCIKQKQCTACGLTLTVNSVCWYVLLHVLSINVPVLYVLSITFNPHPQNNNPPPPTPWISGSGSVHLDKGDKTRKTCVHVNHPPLPSWKLKRAGWTGCCPGKIVN